jgi:hypothetical protein
MLTYETGRGFFEGVCAPGNSTAHFCDPPTPIRESSPLSAVRSTANGTDDLPFTSWCSSGPIFNSFLRRS